MATAPRPHGHTYRAELIVEGDALNDLGLVFDFHESTAKSEGMDR